MPVYTTTLTRIPASFALGPAPDRSKSRPYVVAKTATQREALSVRWHGTETVTRRIAEETPIGIYYNGLPYAVMMATPADLEDFGTGFSITERIVEHRNQLLELQVKPTGLGVELRITVDKTAILGRVKERGRSIPGRTGCGLCGVHRLEEAIMDLPRVAQGEPVRSTAIRAAINDLASGQSLNAETHAVHAAAWSSHDGQLLLIREDVGRHNALDKLIGAMASAAIDARTGFCVITSRCSYEMVQKAALAGIAVIVAISAPTELAIRQAEAAGVTLVALARSDGFAIYAHPERVITWNLRLTTPLSEALSA
jgi:FdhD protein